MLSESALSFLKRLLDTPGPSGFEAAAAEVWRREAQSFASVSRDVTGNSTAQVNPAGRPTIMLAGHIDEIGVIATYIDDSGLIYIAPIGGWDVQVLVGQRICFSTSNGPIYGVVGKKPIHLFKPDERDKAAKMSDIWVDIGATSRDEAQESVSIGDPGVIDARTLYLPNNRIASRSIDNRIGAFTVLEALRRYAASPGEASVIAVATTQEEISYRGGGALVAASRINPAMAIVVDVTHASDNPGAEKRELGEHRIGGGPVLARGASVSPVVFGILRRVAEEQDVPHTVRAVGRDTATDADFIHLAREGVATALVSIPNRYMHTPNELVSLDDVDRTATLLAEACRRVSSATDFTAR